MSYRLRGGTHRTPLCYYIFLRPNNRAWLLRDIRQCRHIRHSRRAMSKIRSRRCTRTGRSARCCQSLTCTSTPRGKNELLGHTGQPSRTLLKSEFIIINLQEHSTLIEQGHRNKGHFAPGWLKVTCTRPSFQDFRQLI